MINLTNNQVIAFNSLAFYNSTLKLRCRIHEYHITIYIYHWKYKKISRYYYIYKNRIECDVFRFGKKNKHYEYKLKKR